MKQSGNSLMENFFFLLSKKQSSSIGVGRRHPERIKRVYFLAQKNPDPATNISYMIHSFSCTAWKPFERSPLEKERPWQVTKKSFSIFQKLSCKLSPHQGCISCGTCSYPKLTEDHVLTSAYVKIFRTVTRNAVNKGVWRKKNCSWRTLNEYAIYEFEWWICDIIEINGYQIENIESQKSPT